MNQAALRSNVQKQEDQIILGAGAGQGLWKSTDISRKFCETGRFEEVYTICLFNNVSETHWSQIISQVPNEQLSRELQEEDLEPICSLSGSFKGSLRNFRFAEK